MNFDEEFDEDLDEDLESDGQEPETIESKTPSRGGKKITVYFMSTIGPGEKKQKLNVNDNNLVSGIKETVGNLWLFFYLGPIVDMKYMVIFLPPLEGVFDSIVSGSCPSDSKSSSNSSSNSSSKFMMLTFYYYILLEICIF